MKKKKDWKSIVTEYKWHLRGFRLRSGQNIFSLPLWMALWIRYLGADSFREFRMSDMTGRPTVGIDLKISKGG